MDMVSNVKDRIFAAADLLYKQSGSSGAFPTVDAVRKQAKVNMNDAATGMREWRRSQTVQVAKADSVLPDAFREACIKALEGLWSQATAMANESLRIAQAGWEAERVENEILREQISAAFEDQTKELEQSHTLRAELQDQLSQANAGLDDAKRELRAVARQTERAEQAARQAEGKLTEIQRLTTELSNELAYSKEQLAASQARHREELDFQRVELSKEREFHKEEQTRLRNVTEQLQNQLQQALEAQVLELTTALKHAIPVGDGEPRDKPLKKKPPSPIRNGNGRIRKQS